MLLSPLLAGLLAKPFASAAFTVGERFQIILNSVPDLSAPLVPDAPVFDIDAFDSNATVIAGLKKLGKTVICYFSAGTYEPWRPDANLFKKEDYGLALDGWPDEHWLKLDSANVRSIMTTRIKMAADKGCDAIDPDNTDGFTNANGIGLTANGAVDFITFLHKTATANGMKIGLKNSQGILSNVGSMMSFAVNEECAINGECNGYDAFLNSGKPVYHIEYPPTMPNVNVNDRNKFCVSTAFNTNKFSTVLKNMTLDGWVLYCDGNSFTTKTNENATSGTHGRPPGGGGGRPTSRPPFSSPPMTSRTTRTTTTRSSTSKTSTTYTTSWGNSSITSTSRTSTSTSTIRTTSSTSTSRPLPPTTTTSRTTSSTSRTTSSTSRTTSSSTSRITTTTSRTSSTSTNRPSSSSSSTNRPTSTSAGAPSCTVAHWGQCGGQDYKGCTNCASGFQCKGVSPPYYYQCL